MKPGPKRSHRMIDAVKWYGRLGGSLTDVAKRFGVSRSALTRAVKQLSPDANIFGRGASASDRTDRIARG